MTGPGRAARLSLLVAAMGGAESLPVSVLFAASTVLHPDVYADVTLTAFGRSELPGLGVTPVRSAGRLHVRRIDLVAAFRVAEFDGDLIADSGDESTRPDGTSWRKDRRGGLTTSSTTDMDGQDSTEGESR